MTAGYPDAHRPIVGVGVVRPWRVGPLGLVALALALLTASCASGSSSSGSLAADTPGGSDALSGTIIVAAASSLAAPFERIVGDFAAANPGAEVALNLDGSSSLAAQVIEGAPVDVVASADVVTMERVAGAGLLAGTPQVFATNALVIVTQPGNPAGVAGLEDLDAADVVALCGEDVPCGRYAQQVLSNAGVQLDESRVTRGKNAGATLAAVAQGDAVAGIVYVTDAMGAADAVATVPISTERNVVAFYPIGVVATSTNPAARAFVDWVVGPAGQAVLARFGFGPPS